MYICNCNGINESAVKAAIERGAKSAAEVYLANGCKMQCGKCKCEIDALLSKRPFKDQRLAS